MKRFLFLIAIIFFVFPSCLFASEISSSPQYVVINFSDTFHFLNWAAPEKEWQTLVKPKAIERLRRIQSLLTVGGKKRKLAWSTLMEYMNYPLDTPSDSSPYIVRMRRILELAEEVDLPVFTPLNGVQWWDELPELWNWWDNDGDQTPGCKNNDFKNCPFKKLQDPAYRKRFIAGYNSNNKWNVDWSEWITPEKFAIRNWGGGDIYVAPSPNLAQNNKSTLSFRTVQKARYEALLKVIYSFVAKWEKEKKNYLFAGLSIGTEITLNGALIPGDLNFKPYGFRAIEDEFCPTTNPICGSEKKWTDGEITSMREAVIHKYVQDFAYTAFIQGFQKEQIFSHVWSEAEPGELRYMNAISAAINYFSQPGMSIYGKALNPLSLSILSSTLAENGYPAWAAPEFAPLSRDESNWHTALFNTLNSEIAPAKLIDIYNETDIINTPAIPELKQILSENSVASSCSAELVHLTTPNKTINPTKLAWDNSQSDDKKKTSVILWKNTIPDPKNNAQIEYQAKKGVHEFILPPTLGTGYYYWAIKQTGCDESHWSISSPRIFYKEIQLTNYPLPWWVQFFQKKAPPNRRGLF